MATKISTSVSQTDNSAINALLGGAKWIDGNITFSFPTDKNNFVSDYTETKEPQYNFSAFTAQMQSAARQAFLDWAAVANLSFSEVSDSATYGVIRLGRSSAVDSDPDGAAAWGYFPGNDEYHGDVWLGYNNPFNEPKWMTYADYGFETIEHEIGHALGLKHPGDYNGTGKGTGPFADTANDCLAYSTMSYRPYPGASTSTVMGNTSYPQTPMIWDIAAIQYIYGANYNTNSGNTSYVFSPNDTTVFKTIWDGGGIDTYDASAYTTGVLLQLDPGSWSTLGVNQLADLGNSQKAPGSIANALLYQNDARSLIENAIGGSGNDTLRGNVGNNTLSGEAGEDAFWGGLGGNDVLSGGAGTDYYWFADDKFSDTISAAADNDQDTVIFQTDWQPSDMTISLIGKDLHLTVKGTEEVLQGWGNNGGYQLNRFYFAQTGGLYKIEFSNTGTGQFSLVT